MQVERDSFTILRQAIAQITADPKEQGRHLQSIQCALTEDEIVALIIVLTRKSKPDNNDILTALELAAERQQGRLKPAPIGEDNRSVSDSTLTRILYSLRRSR